MEHKSLAIIALVITALCVASVEMSGCVNNSTPANSTSAYEFKTGITPPPEVSELMKHGTVVLSFNVTGCPPCWSMTPKMAALQSEYGTGVTFATINDTDTTSRQIFTSYGIDYASAIVVIRGDGAAAILRNNTREIDINTVRSAIDDARQWATAHIPTETPTAPPTATDTYNQNDGASPQRP